MRILRILLGTLSFLAIPTIGAAIFAIRVDTQTGNFDGILSEADTTVQSALEVLDDFTESDPVFSSWDKSTGISITESQIPDLQSYLISESDTLDSVADRGSTTDQTLTAGGVTVTDLIRGGEIDIRQTAESQGLQIFGYDDQATKYLSADIDSSGYANLNTSNAWLLRIGGGNVAYIDNSGMNGHRMYDDIPMSFGQDELTRWHLERDSTNSELVLSYGNTPTNHLTVNSSGDFDFQSGDLMTLATVQGEHLYSTDDAQFRDLAITDETAEQAGTDYALTNQQGSVEQRMRFIDGGAGLGAISFDFSNDGFNSSTRSLRVNQDQTMDLDTMTFAGGSITDSTGAIDFGDEDLTTGGNVEANALSGSTLAVSDLSDCPYVITDAQGNVACGNKRIDTKCAWIEHPTSVDDLKSIWTTNGFSATITKIWCESEYYVTLDLQIDDGTPADVNGTDLVCNQIAEDETLSGDVTMEDGDRLDLAITYASYSTDWLSVCWTVEYDS